MKAWWWNRFLQEHKIMVLGSYENHALWGLYRPWRKKLKFWHIGFWKKKKKQFEAMAFETGRYIANELLGSPLITIVFEPFCEQLVTELLFGSCETPPFKHWATVIVTDLFGNLNFWSMKASVWTSSDRTVTKALKSQILNFLEDWVRTDINQLANGSFRSSTSNTKSSSNLIN